MRRTIAVLTLLTAPLLVTTPAAAAPGSLSGYITDAQGGSVLGASIAVATSPGAPVYTATTDVNGWYEFASLTAGGYLMSITPPGDRPELHTMYYPNRISPWSPGVGVVVSDDAVATASQVLPTEATISGRVTDANDNGVAGVTVRSELDTASGPISSFFPQATTDANGDYVLTDLQGFPGEYGLPGPGVHTLTFVLPGMTTAQLGPFAVLPGDALTGIDLVVTPPIMGTAQLWLAGVPYTPASAFQAPGVCQAPGVFDPASFCPVGSYASVTHLGGGSFNVGPLAPGTYTARAITVFGSPNGPAAPTFTVAPGDSVHCDLFYDASGTSTCTVTNGGGPGDTDGIDDAIEASVPNLVGPGTGDGNGDGELDAEQPHVASLPDPTGGFVTLAAPAGQPLSDVTATSPLSLPSPPVGVDDESAVIGFTVAVPASGATTTVDVFVHDPSGVVNSYWKYDTVTGWTNATSIATFTVLGGGITRATLTLTDGGFADHDGVANGEIVDPGMFAQYRPYRFSGFGHPVDPAPVVNMVRAGSTVPVKWVLHDAGSNPVDDPASFEAIRLIPGDCATDATTDAVEVLATGTGLISKGGGAWQFNWKTARHWTGCGTLVLSLADGSVHTALFHFR